ncbi:alpha/beta fold hydrolase, partial [Curtobacterium sp. Csp2]|uniref:alpha/beta fold hydrolase n=1 Tax=Curtobacterium sp. Csp2 TaxID=2495430 RepID=UPI001C2ED8FD
VYNMFQPLMYQVATGGLNAGDVTYFLRSLRAKQSNADFRHGLLTGIDAEHRVAEMSDGEHLHYDWLILANGVNTSYFGTPDVVRAVVLVGPVCDRSRRTLLRQALDLTRDTAVETPRMNAVVTTDYLRSIRQYVRELGPMLRHRLEDVLPRLTQPVLVVRGDRDPIARREWSESLAQAAPRGALVELPGGHHVQERHPEAFGRLVEEFRRVQTLEDAR